MTKFFIIASLFAASLASDAIVNWSVRSVNFRDSSDSEDRKLISAAKYVYIDVPSRELRGPLLQRFKFNFHDSDSSKDRKLSRKWPIREV